MTMAAIPTMDRFANQDSKLMSNLHINDQLKDALLPEDYLHAQHKSSLHNLRQRAHSTNVISKEEWQEDTS